MTAKSPELPQSRAGLATDARALVSGTPVIQAVVASRWVGGLRSPVAASPAHAAGFLELATIGRLSFAPGEVTVLVRIFEIVCSTWSACQLPPFSGIERTEETWQFRVDPKSLRNIRFFWARLCLALCNEALVKGGLEIPIHDDEAFSIIWIDALRLSFLGPESKPEDAASVARPLTISPVMIAVGGPSGAGKTTTVARLKMALPGRVVTHLAYTTRQRRSFEIDGIDYHFRSMADWAKAHDDPAFGGFVEARGHHYWICPSELLRTVWQGRDKVHVFFISQRSDFEQRRRLFPQLRWLWLDSDADDLRARLTRRGDLNVESSVAYNRTLASQSIEDLVDLHIDTRASDSTVTAARIAAFCLSLEDRP